MRNLLEPIYSISVLLSPVLITASPKIAAALGADSAPKDIEVLRTLSNLSDGASFTQPGILFPRMEKAAAEDKPAQAKNDEKKTVVSDDNLIEIGDFTKVDLRVVKIVHAEPVMFLIRPGDYAWQWPRAWIDSSLPRLVESGQFSQKDADALIEEFRRAESAPSSMILSPSVIEIIAEKV